MNDAMRPCCNSLVAVNPAGHKGAERRLAVLHHAHLYGGGMCAQGDIILAIVLFDEESILHIAGRMLFGEVKRGEIMPVILDLRPFSHNETQALENIDDLDPCQR